MPRCTCNARDCGPGSGHEYYCGRTEPSEEVYEDDEYAAALAGSEPPADEVPVPELPYGATGNVDQIGYDGERKAAARRSSDGCYAPIRSKRKART